MTELIRNLCIICILSGLVLYAMPEGGIKQIASSFCVCVCVLLIVSAFKAFDFEMYASQLARYREAEYKLSDASADTVKRLNRSVIEDECCSYIIHEAANKGLSLSKVKVITEWDAAGYWVPYRAEIYSTYNRDIYNTVVYDLGIPGERITWIE